MNQLVKKTMFEFDEEYEYFVSHFKKTHDMLDEIERARRATYQLLGVWLGIFELNTGSTRAHKNALDVNINSSLMDGLSHPKNFPDSKIISTFLHPLFRFNTRMVKAGLWTTHQYKMGYAKLEERVIR